MPNATFIEFTSGPDNLGRRSFYLYWWRGEMHDELPQYRSGPWCAQAFLADPRPYIRRARKSGPVLLVGRGYRRHARPTQERS